MRSPVGDTQEGWRKEMSALSGETEMTFDRAVAKAKAGARITRPGRSAWLEFDPGAGCLTLHEGQAYRVRWTASPEDERAEDWKVPIEDTETVAAWTHIINGAVLAERERCARVASEFNAFVYESRKVDGYSTGSYAVIDGFVTMQRLAGKIRSAA